MRSFIALALVLLSSPAAPHEYRIDAGHSDVAFSIPFLGHPVRGRFDAIRGTLQYAPEDPTASSISVVIDVKSIATGSAHRDEHLRSPDFFEVEKYPTIAFRSTSVTRSGKDFLMRGQLSMHGITREVTIPFRETIPPVADPHGNDLVFFSGALRIARRDYGILGGSKYNDWFDQLRAKAMGDSVDITLDIGGWAPRGGRPTSP